MSGLFKKTLYFLLTLYISLTAIFVFVRFSPGDPVERILGPNARHEDIIKYRQQLKLDVPISKQYISYFKEIFKGDLGESLFSGKPVTALLLEHLPPTLIIATFSVVISLFLGIFFGVLAGYFQSTFMDHLLRFISITSLSFPIFSLGPVLVLLFSIKFSIFPVSEWGGFSHAILPIITLIIPLTAILSKMMRNKYLEERRFPWVDFLRAKGMDNLGIQFRLIKICLPTILNIMGIQLSVVLAGTMVTETIFDIPGMGTLLFDSIQNRDYPVIQGVIIYSTIVYMTIYFLVDLFNEKIDPRIAT
jgi:peptide/nickel transport system permease protein